MGVGVYVPAVAAVLSDLTIDTDLVMGAHDITLGAAQTVDGKDVSTLGIGTAFVKSGYYVGDGATSKTIATGLTTIKGLMIYLYQANSAGAGLIKTDQSTTTYAHIINTGASLTTSFGANFSGTNFYVDDNGADTHPNKLNQGYIWIAWGE